MISPKSAKVYSTGWRSEGRFSKLHRIPRHLSVVTEGISFLKQTIDLGRGEFTNLYSLVIAKDFVRFVEIVSCQKPRPLSKFLGADCYFAVNAGYRFLCDDSKISPKNYNYHLHVNRGAPFSLPNFSKYALVQNAASLRVEKVIPAGFFEIRGRKFFWSGNTDTSKPGDRGTLHSLVDVKLEKRVLANRNLILTKELPGFSAERGFVMVGFRNKGGKLAVGTMSAYVKIYDALFYLEAPFQWTKFLKAGDVVTKWGIDRLSDENTDHAITIGSPIYNDPQKTWLAYKSQLASITFTPNGDRYYGRADIKQARSFIAQTNSGEMVLGLFDARPNVKGQEGLTLAELSVVLHRMFNLEWAYQLDGGQSARIAVRNKGGVAVFGNKHYRKYFGKSGKSVWDGFVGRPVTSAIVFRGDA